MTGEEKILNADGALERVQLEWNQFRLDRDVRDPAGGERRACLRPNLANRCKRC